LKWVGQQYPPVMGAVDHLSNNPIGRVQKLDPSTACRYPLPHADFRTVVLDFVYSVLANDGSAAGAGWQMISARDVSGYGHEVEYSIPCPAGANYLQTT
jgi:hypothetical protein